MRSMTLMVVLMATAAMAQDKGAERRTYFFQADLKGADFRQADLSKAHLSRADLRSADLRGANLEGAYLRKADLRFADLRGAKFSTKLKGVELKSTELAGARYDATTVLPFDDARAAELGMVKVEIAVTPTAAQVEGALAQK
jgi:uncharacterized protein YjbI with pentapeptide repeats